MEMLVSVFCPFEGSSNDRVLYVWGCARAGCQKKDGSVRAYRSLRYNPKYARKLEQQRARVAARSVVPSMPEAHSRTNPFSSTSGPEHATTTGGIGDLVFGATVSTIPGASGPNQLDAEDWPEDGAPDDETVEEDNSDGGSDDEDEVEEDNLANDLSAVSLTKAEPDPAWSSQPSYRPLYLSTVQEYITPKPPPSVSKKPIQEAQSSSDTGGAPWGAEPYEVMRKVDDVFERFVARVQEEPQQVLRYDLSGAPLPFSSRDAVYPRMFPITTPAPGTAVTVTGSPPTRHEYNPSTLDLCPRCGSPRVFECQIMPNLINVLQRPDPPSSKAKKQSSEERQAELNALLKGGVDGMEWGTVFIFSCLADCCQDSDGSPAKETWAEEIVVAQWDD